MFCMCIHKRNKSDTLPKGWLPPLIKNLRKTIWDLCCYDQFAPVMFGMSLKIILAFVTTRTHAHFQHTNTHTQTRECRL